MIRFLLPMMVLAGAAKGGCVTGADMAGGVLARFDSGLELELSRPEPGRVHVEERPASRDELYRTVRRHGFWDVEAYGTRPDGGPDREWGVAWHYEDAESLPAPELGLVWSGWQTAVVGGTVRRSDNLLVSVRLERELEVGGCRYPALQVQVLVDRATEGPLILRELFLTELGVALPWTWAEEGQVPSEVSLVSLARVTE